MPGGGEGAREVEREPFREPAGVLLGVCVARRLAEERSKSTAPIRNTTGSVRRMETEVGRGAI